MRDEAYEVVCIACSAGGLRALKSVLKDLPASFRAPILVAMHRGDTPSDHLATMLTGWTSLAIKIAEQGEPLEPGTVYIAPGGRHLEIETGGRVSILRRGRIRFVCPSGDVLFASAAAAYGERSLAVVLTGQGTDGAAGVCAVRLAGGFVVVQDPATSQYPGMPCSAIETRKVDLVLPLEQIGGALNTLVASALAA